MTRKILAFSLAMLLAFSLIACGEEETTTLTAMVVSVNGTVLTVVETDADAQAQEGDMTMPSGMGDFSGFSGEGFTPWGDGTMPDGATMPSFDGENMPQFDGSNMPSLPEGETMPSFDRENMPQFGGGNFPGFGGEFDGTQPNMENFASDAEKKEIDIGQAHISVEIDGGKATGSIEDIQPGVFVTITMDGDGNVTNVLVSQRTGFGGRGSKTSG